MSVYKILVPQGHIEHLRANFEEAGIAVFVERDGAEGYVPNTFEMQLGGQVSDRAVEDAVNGAGCMMVSTPPMPD